MGIILSGTPPIRDFSKHSRKEPENKTESAFVLQPDYDPGTLLIAKHAYKTRQRGLFFVSQLHLPFIIPKPPVRKNIIFLFSEKTGLKAYCDKTYYPVEFSAFINKDFGS